MVEKLDQQAQDQALAKLTGWKPNEEKSAIERQFSFDDFVDAFAFMTQVALLAEKADHHPEWSNVYHRVDIRLTTHDANGLTQKDIALAEQIDALVS